MLLAPQMQCNVCQQCPIKEDEADVLLGQENDEVIEGGVRLLCGVLAHPSMGAGSSKGMGSALADTINRTEVCWSTAFKEGLTLVSGSMEAMGKFATAQPSQGMEDKQIQQMTEVARLLLELELTHATWGPVPSYDNLKAALEMELDHLQHH